MPDDLTHRTTRFTTVISRLPASTPFVAPEALERQHGKRLQLRLGANESAFAVSPKAVAAMQKAASESNWYGDPESHELRVALAARFNAGIENIVVGNGIDGLLEYAVRAFVEPGDAVVTSRGTYPTFNYHVIAQGGQLHRVSYRDDRADLEALLETVRDTNARLVYLANPDNPSGSWLSGTDIVAFVSALPPTCTLVLDEAYCEFAADDSVPVLPIDHPQVFRVRTFSKVHGMAGARVGYAITDRAIIEAIGKFRNQFEVARISQAGSLAALADLEFVRSVIKAVEEGRRDYERLAGEIGCPFIPSATNFVCLDAGGPERARAILNALLALGVFIRMPGEEPLNRCIRVTVGTAPQRSLFGELLKQVWRSM